MKKFLILTLFQFYSFTADSQDISEKINDLINSEEINDLIKVNGVFLIFEEWPNEEDERLIVENLKENGLTERSRGEMFYKSWAFEWKNLGSKSSALKICENLLKTFSIKSCSPDDLVTPQALDHGLVTCGYLERGSNQELSKYWGQEMVGADLIRKELRNLGDPPDNLIAVQDYFGFFDTHGDEVRSVISSNTKTGVLPKVDTLDTLELMTVETRSDTKAQIELLISQLETICSSSKTHQGADTAIRQGADTAIR